MKTFQLMALFILNSSISMAQVPDYVPSNGLLGWWPLDGNAIDSSNNENHGLVDGASPTKDRFGLDNKALAFDGINDEVTFNVKQLLNFSISVWHKPNDKGNITNPIFQLRKDCSQTGFNRNGYAFMGTKNEDNKLKIGFRYEARNCATVGASYGFRIDDAFASLDDWSHYVMTRSDSTQDIIIYQNGKKIFEGNTWIDFIPEGKEVLRIGKLWENQNSYTWTRGYTDDLGYWDRVLDSNEVKALFLSKKCDSKFTKKPRDTSVSGIMTQFKCEHNDSTATYSWETNLGLGWIQLSNAGQYSGVESNILQINNLNSTNDNQLFRCIAFTNCGSDTTNEVRLNIEAINTIHSLSKTLSVSPNPTTGLITINGIVKPIAFKVFNLTGDVIQEGQTNETIDLSEFPKGIYFISLDGIKKRVIKSE